MALAPAAAAGAPLLGPAFSVISLLAFGALLGTHRWSPGPRPPYALVRYALLPGLICAWLVSAAPAGAPPVGYGLLAAGWGALTLDATRPGSRLRREMLGWSLGALLGAALLAWAPAPPRGGAEELAPGSYAAALCGLAVLWVGWIGRCCVRFETWASSLRLQAELGLAAWADAGERRVAGRGEDAPLAVAVEIDRGRAPLWLEASARSPALDALAPGLVVRSRMDSASDGVSAGDVILDQLLYADGAPAALISGLLEGLHERLLPLLHEYPGSSLHGGRITLRMPASRLDDRAGARIRELERLAAALEARARAAASPPRWEVDPDAAPQHP